MRIRGHFTLGENRYNGTYQTGLCRLRLHGAEGAYPELHQPPQLRTHRVGGSPTGTRSVQVQQRWGIPRLYTDHTELAADPEIEAVAVSADFALQGEIAKDLLSAGKQVFMEKPMAVSVQQAESIVAAGKAAGTKLMVGYMKRYDVGNELVRSKVDQFRETGELGGMTYVRNHGFCGEWICNLDTPMITSDVPKPDAPAQTPEWLPSEWVRPYLSYLQQYTHNINLLRWFLDAGDQAQVKHVDLDDNGYSGVVIFDMAGVRVTLETGRVSHYRWDEHTQIYFEDGWVHTWAPPLLLKNTPAEVEIYRAGETQEISRPIPKPNWTWAYRREAGTFHRKCSERHTVQIVR